MRVHMCRRSRGFDRPAGFRGGNELEGGRGGLLRGLGLGAVLAVPVGMLVALKTSLSTSEPP